MPWTRTKSGELLPEPEGRKLVGRYRRNGVPNIPWKVRWMAKFHVRYTRIRIVIILAIILFFAYIRFKLGHDQRGRVHNVEGKFQALINISAPTTYRWDNDTHLDEERSLPNLGPLDNRLLWRLSLVDRAILQKLDSPSPKTKNSRFCGTPLLTNIPEDVSPTQTSSEKAGLDAICESARHPRPCRFLLPLRIAGQEPEARIHLSQIARLARELNRTLVLPNVGDGKIGACYKWNLSMYYNLSLLATEGDEEDWFVELETFRSWTHAQGRQELIKSQLVSVASTLPAGAAFHGNAVYINPDVLVLEYNSTVTWERHLPGCFFTQVRNLDFETMPVFLSTGLAGNGGYTKPIGNSIIHAFSAISSSTSGRDTSLEIPLARVALPDRPSELEPKVVLVNWDLHHPIFSSPAKGSSLYYSEKMRDLAKKRAPEQPYLAVHWEMDTIDPKLLPDCAHALVDVLASLLRDESLSTNITTVWFASDYPYPIVTQNRSQRRPAAIAKSGTFKDFEIMHEEAIEILRSAFDKQGELNGWKLTDFIGTNEDEAHMEGGMLQDSGVIGILDKIVSMNADLFVSGSNRCSRRSSFRREVVEARSREWRNNGQSHLKNLVDIFG